jgi:hypothetical protein
MTHERFDDLTEELSAESRRLERKISDLVSLRKLVAEKESAAGLRREGPNGRPPGEVGCPNSQKVSIHELPELTPRFLKSFLADRPTEAPSSKQNSELRGAPKWRPQLPPRRVMGPFLIQIPSQPLP